MTGLYEKYHNAGLEVLLISEEPADQLREFASFAHIPFPILSDPRREAHDNYGVNGIPFTLLIDRAGKVATGMAGYSPTGFDDDFTPAVQTVLKGK